MSSVLLSVQIVVCTLLIILVLFQRSDSDGLGLGGGNGGGMMSARGKANFFTRLTAILAAIFMINSLLYSVMITRMGASAELNKIAEKNKPAEKTGEEVAKDAAATPDAKVDDKVTDSKVTDTPSDVAAPAPASQKPVKEEEKVPVAEEKVKPATSEAATPVAPAKQ